MVGLVTYHYTGLLMSCLFFPVALHMIIRHKEEVIIHKDEAFLVKGTVVHSVWSNQKEETVMIGISVE